MVAFNSNFETGWVGWYSEGYNYRIKAPGFWSVFPTVEIDQTTAAVGKASLKIGNPRGDYMYLHYPYLNLKPNTKYTLSCYAKTDTPGAVLSMRIRVYAGEDTVDKGFEIRPTTEWARYSTTIEFSKMPNFVQELWIGTPQFHTSGDDVTPITPGALWIDAVQVEEGPLSDYHMGGACEAGSKLNNQRHNRYYLGEKPSADIKVYSPVFTNGLEVSFRVEDYRHQLVREGKAPLALNGQFGEKTVDLAVSGKGYFHVFFNLVKDGKSQASWEEQFVVIEPHHPVDFDDDSYWGHHVTTFMAPANRGMVVENRIPPAEWADMAEDVGVRWHRDFSLASWGGVEQQKNDFTFSDEWVDLLTKHKIRIMPILGTQLRSSIPSWVPHGRQIKKPYPGAPKGLSLPDPDAWKKYVTTTVGHFKDRIKCWELMNEPNWEMLPEDYLELLKNTREAAKAADPSSVIVAPSSTSDFGANPMNFILDLLKMGGGKYLDVISFHFYLDYNQRKSPEACTVSTSQMCRNLQKIMDQYAPDKPAWSTEMCWYNTSDYYRSKRSKKFLGEQAVDEGQTPSVVAGYLVQNHVVNLGHGTKKYFDFTLQMMTSSSPQIPADGTPNAIMPAYCNLTWMLDKAEFLQQIALGEKVCAYAFKVKERLVTVIWTINEKKGRINLEKPNDGIRIYDMMGNECPVGETEISNSPIYLVGEKISQKDYLDALCNLQLAGLDSIEVRSVLASDGNRPSLKIFLKNLFAQPSKGRIKIAGLPEGISLLDETKEYPFEVNRTTAITVPVQLKAPVQGSLGLWVQSGEYLKNLTFAPRVAVSKKTGRPIKMDGVLSDEWKEALLFKINEKNQIAAGDVAQWAGASDLSARVFGQWEANGDLYFALEVMDQHVILSEDGSGLFTGSSVELFFDSALEKNVFENDYGEGCSQFILSPACQGKPLRLEIETAGRGKLADKSRIEAVSRMIPGGYTLEVRIPSSELGATLSSKGGILGFNVGINSAELANGKVRRKNQMIWNGKGDVFRNRSSMETLVLE